MSICIPPQPVFYLHALRVSVANPAVPTTPTLLLMNPDDEVCLCFHVPLRKIRMFLKREDPPVASLISECLGAGTGCQWCVPFLRHLHAQHTRGETPDLKISPQRYAQARTGYHKTGVREPDVLKQGAPDATDADVRTTGPHTPPPDTSTPDRT